MTEEVDILKILNGQKKSAEYTFIRAVDLKDQFLIAYAIGQLNEIDQKILIEEYRKKDTYCLRMQREEEREKEGKGYDHVLRKRAKEHLRERRLAISG